MTLSFILLFLVRLFFLLFFFLLDFLIIHILFVFFDFLQLVIGVLLFIGTVAIVQLHALD